MPKRLASCEPLQSCEIHLAGGEAEVLAVAGRAGCDDESARFVGSDGFDAAFAKLFSESRSCRSDAPVLAFRGLAF